MREIRELQDFWHKHAEHELMLCTIVGKKGSGYRSPGAKKIICRNGKTAGYLSGGCLEGDIIRNALDRWDEAPFRHSFSTMSPEDRLMGYQTGCNGIIDILFELLPNSPEGMKMYLPFGPRENIAGISISLLPDILGSRAPLTILPETAQADVFIDRWIEPLNLFVVGCGPDALPFADLAPVLGWNITFIDYREGNKVDEKSGVTSHIMPIDGIGNHLPPGKRNAVVVMTHNYEADLAVIAQINGKHFGYIGCLGPQIRFKKMQEDLPSFHNKTMDMAWAETVHAPAGLKQGRTPEDIAFSIVAEIQMEIGLS